MLRLIFTVCMIDAPDICEQRELLVYEPMPVAACVMGAMPELANWRQTHPNWRIARWRCEDDRTVKAADSRTRDAQRLPALPHDPTTPGAVPVAMSR